MRHVTAFFFSFHRFFTFTFKKGVTHVIKQRDDLSTVLDYSVWKLYQTTTENLVGQKATIGAPINTSHIHRTISLGRTHHSMEEAYEYIMTARWHERLRRPLPQLREEIISQCMFKLWRPHCFRAQRSQSVAAQIHSSARRVLEIAFDQQQVPG